MLLPLRHRMDVFAVELSGCFALELDDQSFDEHVWLPNDQMDVIRENGTGPDGEPGTLDVGAETARNGAGLDACKVDRGIFER